MTLSPVPNIHKYTKKKPTRKNLKLPFQFAAIDLGSNSIKVRISEILRSGAHKTLWENKYPVQLGHETFLTGKLSSDIMKDALQVLKRIHSICRDYKVEVISAVATSAVREASNRKVFFEKVSAKTGIEIEVIPGSEEARLIALGVLGEIVPTRKDYLILDIGGGSAETIFSNDYTIIDTQSLPLGAVRLKELFVKTDPISQTDFELLQDHIESVINTNLKLRAIPQDLVTYGCAGTITALVQMNGNREKNTISLSQLNQLLPQLKAMNRKQRMKKFKLDGIRAEIILPGAMVLKGLMKRLSLFSVELSTHGLRDGLLQDYMERHGLKDEKVFDHDRAFQQSLFMLSEKYSEDRQHIMQVCTLALGLFDSLQSLHGYNAMERNILKGAALLHDIGHFISYSKHHKHAYYLIIHSDLPGITEREKLLIATVARYHRRAVPNMKQEEYRILNPVERLLVRRLAGILRIADALDREHQSFVSGIECQIKDKKIKFIITPARHIPVELNAAEKKADLFEAVFHCKTVFQENKAK